MTDDLGTNGPEGEGALASETSDNRVVIGNNAAAQDGSSDGGNIDWAAGLSEDNRALVTAKKWTSADDGLKAYRELEAHSSKAIVPPAQDAPAEDWDKFWNKLGRPEKADGYELKVDRENLPAEFPYDETLAIDYRTAAHEVGLTPQQAQKLHDWWVGGAAKSFNGINEQGVKREGDAHREFTGKWGDASGETFKTNVEMMSRAAAQLGITESLKAGGFLSQDGALRDAKMGFALARIGRELFSEDSMATGAGGVLDNPFSKDHLNLTKQGQLIRNDPNKARALIRASGQDPTKFGL